MALLLIGGFVGLWITVSSVRTLTVFEIRTTDGAVRESWSLDVFGTVLWESQGSVTPTAISEALARHGVEPDVDEAWVYGGEISRWGNESSYFLAHGVLQLSELSCCDVENLLELVEVSPALVRRILDDLVCADVLGASGMLARVLCEMCADPTTATIDRLMVEWNAITGNPDLYRES